MRNESRRRQRPQVEGLESWAPPSGMAGAMGGPIATREVRATAPAIALQGTVHGGYIVNQGNPDTGKSYRIATIGSITPLGQTSETAKVQTTGFIASGMATGTMTISSRRGNLTLRLTGPVQPAFAPLPTTLSYTITGGTRTYIGATGSGSIGVTLHPSVLSDRIGLITLVFRPSVNPVA